MSNVPNYYDVLGVGLDADEAEIKQAFQAQARLYTSADDPGAKELKAAYDILTNPAKRQQYDAYMRQQSGGGVKPITGQLRSVSRPAEPAPEPSANGHSSGGVDYWEYLTLKSSRNYGTTKYYVNDEQFRDWKDARFSFVINEIGKDGWEMVGIATMGSEMTFVFKRPAG